MNDPSDLKRPSRNYSDYSRLEKMPPELLVNLDLTPLDLYCVLIPKYLKDPGEDLAPLIKAILLGYTDPFEVVWQLSIRHQRLYPELKVNYSRIHGHINAWLIKNW